MKIDFICVGMQKCGTTTLHNILQLHPQVYVPKEKEIHFFDQNWEKGIEWYESFFVDAGENRIIGEVTPDYMVYPWIAERMINALGKGLKIIILLRNPADRAYSQYNHYRFLKVETANSFEDAIRREQNNYRIDRMDSWYEPPYYLAKGYYFPKVSQYFTLFGQQKCKVFIFEEFIANIDESLKELCMFLNISNFDRPIKMHSNKSTIARYIKLWDFVKSEYLIRNLFKYLLGNNYKHLHNFLSRILIKPAPQLSFSMRNKIIQKFYIDDIKKLEEILGKNLQLWYSGNRSGSEN